ncbi:MAG TPA: hypothetical protein VGK26_08185 [Thermoanaerobaculia bacterium]
MKPENEIKSQVSAIRERVKELSGFYISEGAAMTYALEWVLGKRETSPAGELGRAGKDSQKIVESLTTAVEKATASATKAAKTARKATPPTTKKAATPPAGKRK